MKISGFVTVSGFVIATVVAATVLAASPVSQGEGTMLALGGPPEIGMQHPMERPPCPPPMVVNLPELQRIMDDIKIDKAVSSKIIAVSRSFKKELDARVLKIQREELDIREELLKDHPDLSVIRKAIEKKTGVLAEIEFSQIKRDLDIKALLTPEQYEQLKSAMHLRLPPMPEAFGSRPGRDRREGGSPGSP